MDVKCSTLKVSPISEVQPVIKWLIPLFSTKGIILYKKKVIEKLYSKNFTEKFTERCSAKIAILKKSVLQYSCPSSVVKYTVMKFHRYGSVGF